MLPLVVRLAVHCGKRFVWADDRCTSFAGYICACLNMSSSSVCTEVFGANKFPLLFNWASLQEQGDWITQAHLQRWELFQSAPFLFLPHACKSIPETSSSRCPDRCILKEHNHIRLHWDRAPKQRNSNQALSVACIRVLPKSQNTAKMRGSRHAGITEPK